MTNPPALSPARAIRVIHAALVVGPVLAAAAMAVARYTAGNPWLASDRSTALMLAVAPVALVLLAITVLRPKVPARTFDQSPEAFWVQPETRGPAIVLWAVIEGAGLGAAVTYYLTGGLAPAAAFVVALLAEIHMRPGRLEGEGGP
jgi:hypothetical protein